MSFPSTNGRTVTVGVTVVDALVALAQDARARAFDEVLEVLDRDYERTKDCGDPVTAEALEVIRAKVRAKKDL